MGIDLLLLTLFPDFVSGGLCDDEASMDGLSPDPSPLSARDIGNLNMRMWSLYVRVLCIHSW